MGAEKYEDRNWQKGQPVSRYYDSLMRHVYKFMRGDKDENHGIAIVWNAFAMLWTVRQIEKGNLEDKWDDRKDVWE